MHPRGVTVERRYLEVWLLRERRLTLAVSLLMLTDEKARAMTTASGVCGHEVQGWQREHGRPDRGAAHRAPLCRAAHLVHHFHVDHSSGLTVSNTAILLEST